MQAIVKTLAYKKGITLDFDVAADLPRLFADEAKFKQIMYNLLSNAIKFTPDKAEVAVTVTRGDQPERAWRARGSESPSPGECLRSDRGGHRHRHPPARP